MARAVFIEKRTKGIQLDLTRARTKLKELRSRLIGSTHLKEKREGAHIKTHITNIGHTILIEKHINEMRLTGIGVDAHVLTLLKENEETTPLGKHLKEIRLASGRVYIYVLTLLKENGQAALLKQRCTQNRLPTGNVAHCRRTSAAPLWLTRGSRARVHPESVIGDTERRSRTEPHSKASSAWSSTNWLTRRRSTCALRDQPPSARQQTMTTGTC
jgi:hypothetical protein